MALRLSQYEQENKILQRQIVEIQEEERAEIARDLHDEVGPLLFSINVDATAIPQLARSGSLNDLTERTNRIHEAASRIQHTVKSILRQLKPVDVLDFGLKVAIRELISFWQLACQTSNSNFAQHWKARILSAHGRRSSIASFRKA
ncbi:MAG: histidine kinase [Rhizomicrobium sp.]